MIRVNKRITKRFARFLKENGVYFYYAKNMVNAINKDIAKHSCSHRTFNTLSREPNAILGAFCWSEAKYPPNMSAQQLNKFWSGLDCKWCSMLRDEAYLE